jgi:hypothetical protein
MIGWYTLFPKMNNTPYFSVAAVLLAAVSVAAVSLAAVSVSVVSVSAVSIAGVSVAADLIFCADPELPCILCPV